jgi:hypothetical protein
MIQIQISIDDDKQGLGFETNVFEREPCSCGSPHCSKKREATEAERFATSVLLDLVSTFLDDEDGMIAILKKWASTKKKLETAEREISQELSRLVDEGEIDDVESFKEAADKLVRSAFADDYDIAGIGQIVAEPEDDRESIHRKIEEEIKRLEREEELSKASPNDGSIVA